MYHTIKSLNNMSDFEINKALMVILGFELSNWLNNDYGHYKLEGSSCIAPVKNYCNNPSDIMPLVFQHLTRLEKTPDGWEAESNPFKKIFCCKYTDTNPLRAAACCLILFLQTKINENTHK